MGTSMISAVLSPIADTALSISMDHYGVYRHIKEEILDLKITLDEVNRILEEAEERQIQSSNVRELLRNMVDICYEARDVLDDFITSAAVNANRSTNPTPVTFDCLPPPFAFLLPILSCLGFYWSSGVQVVIPLAQRCVIAYHIKSIRGKLDDIMNKKGILDIRRYVDPGGSETNPTRQSPYKGPYQDKQRDVFVGRDAVKEDIMRKVLDHTNTDVQLIPIWGMGGIGKTTLAQSIYNDEKVKQEDYPKENRIWLFAGKEKFNAVDIIARIIDPSKKENYTESDIAYIQEKLRDKFKGNKFLIVLDDVWDVVGSGWELLWDPLTSVDKGGVIIMTTRDTKCIMATKSPVVPDPIEFLSDDDCWEIFKRHAYNNTDPDNDRNQKLEIGRQIVTKLKGLPLAAKVVGSSLFYDPDVRNWRNFLSSPLRKLNTEEDDVIPVLRWSYNRLPSHLKQCFSYCALFPKDHVFDQKELVKMWMAHDIILKEAQGEEAQGNILKDIEAQYFKELVNASFFQCINGNYVMHDMIHDLALSNKDFITLSREHSLPPQMDNVRHVRIINDDDYAKNFCLCKSKRILTVYTWGGPFHSSRTLPHLGKDVLASVFKQWKSIRVLVLSDYGINEIPDCINELKHLRYLDVSETKVTSLPDSLFDLYNLQTLAVPDEVDLPMKVGNLKKLRHLIGANKTSCKVIAQLTFLQELEAVTVREGDCISELRHLRRLRGTLTILGLGNVTSSEDAAQAMMQDKIFVENLKLIFKRCIRSSEDLEYRSSRDVLQALNCHEISRDVLEALNCPPNLKVLEIFGYNGDKFPSWLTNASNSMRFLSFLTIHGCGVVELLQLDAFVSLKQLHVAYCSNLKRIRLAKEVAATIEELIIFVCPELREMEIVSLPSLRGLRIWECDKLVSFSPCLVKIQFLEVVYCNLCSLMFFNLHGIESLKILRIFRCPMLKQFFVAEEGSTSSSSSSITAVLSLPDDEEINLWTTHKFEHDVEGRLVLNRR